MHLTLPPFDSYDDDDCDFETLPTELQQELVEAFDRIFPESGERIPGSTGVPCMWLDMETKTCRHYEHRPCCCREFQPGNEICLEDRLSIGKGIGK